MKNNTLTTLHYHLFNQLERLGDASLTGEALVQEINRAKAVTEVAERIISNGRLALDAIKAADLSPDMRLPLMLSE